MKLRKRTRIWLLVFGASTVLASIIGVLRQGNFGCVGGLALGVAIVSCLVLIGLGLAALFRAIGRRLTLRLAFSYFLIGIVPIPLLALLLAFGSYIVAHQVIATRVRREATSYARESIATGRVAATARVESGKVVATDAEWLPIGTAAAWERTVTMPRPVLWGRQAFLASGRPDGNALEIRFVSLTEPAVLQELADRTGYAFLIEVGRGSRRKAGYEVRVKRRSGSPSPENRLVRPRGAPPASNRLVDREWVTAVYVERALAAFQKSEDKADLLVFLARTSPSVLASQFFAQGVPEIGRVFWAVTVVIAGSLLIVYLIALAIAFGLVGSITRNVNRLTRASEAIGRGDFSVRVNSKSRDQIGDLARSFDGMATSIERLLVQTAIKERLEGEIAIARTIQQKLLPPPEKALPGFTFLAHFQPVAEIGGDYYDYLPTPEGRTAVAVGDVSGHGLPTGLLVATAKAALATLVESGFAGCPLFTRLNDLILRSTDSRNYMTLTLFVYDAATRRGDLTNAGQLAPYRLRDGAVEALSLPSFPLGVSARSDFPSHAYDFVAGDRLVFVTDGFVEAASPSGEPFGFERVEALLQAETASDAAGLRNALLSAIAAHTASAPPDDDRTLVILTLE